MGLELTNYKIMMLNQLSHPGAPVESFLKYNTLLIREKRRETNRMIARKKERKKVSKGMKAERKKKKEGRRKMGGV